MFGNPKEEVKNPYPFLINELEEVELAIRRNSHDEVLIHKILNQYAKIRLMRGH